MEIDNLLSIIGIATAFLTNIILVTFTYGKIVTRVTHLESDIIALFKKSELHSQELKSIHVIEGQLKTLIEFIKKD